MEKIEPGKFVEFGYNLYEITDDGETLVYETAEDSPETIIFGVTQGVFLPLEQALEGKQAGDKFDVRLTPADGFGEYDPEKVVELGREIFTIDGKFDSEMVRKDAVLPMMTSTGEHMFGRVLDVTDQFVKMDFNHLLAGKNVRLEGSVRLVREATPEELKPETGCSCGEGCGCEGCGDGGADMSPKGGCCGCH